MTILLVILVLLHVSPIAAQVPPTGIADSDLADRVRATLVGLRVLSVEPDEVRVHVTDGGVRLEGCVGTKAEKEEINLRVKLIPGVQSLDNAMTLGCPKKLGPRSSAFPGRLTREAV